jgi:hypothetical protein
VGQLPPLEDELELELDELLEDELLEEELDDPLDEELLEDELDELLEELELLDPVFPPEEDDELELLEELELLDPVLPPEEDDELELLEFVAASPPPPPPEDEVLDEELLEEELDDPLDEELFEGELDELLEFVATSPVPPPPPPQALIRVTKSTVVQMRGKTRQNRRQLSMEIISFFMELSNTVIGRGVESGGRAKSGRQALPDGRLRDLPVEPHPACLCSKAGCRANTRAVLQRGALPGAEATGAAPADCAMRAWTAAYSRGHSPELAEARNTAVRRGSWLAARAVRAR